MIPISWTNVKRKLSELNPWEYNPRQITEASAARLVDSYEQFGQVETIAIEPDGTIVNGHQRYFTWKLKYGISAEIDVRVSSRQLTHDERRKLTIYLHEGATGEWDWDMVPNLYEPVELVEFGMPEWKVENAFVPDFRPVGIGEQPRLDQKKPVICPECAYEFQA